MPTNMDETTRTQDSGPLNRGRILELVGILPGDATRTSLGSRLAVGRAADAGLRLEWSAVSRNHVEFYRQGPLFAIRDLGSTNGTYLDGHRIEHAAVRPGMLLRLGSWLGMLQESSVRDPESSNFREWAPGVLGGASLGPLISQLACAARAGLPVVLVGPTGVGKERFAHAFHGLSESSGPFHPVNCAALTPSLADAQLFGYVRGAFTGADRNHLGHLRSAHTGTLFLDEVAELDPAVQAKLLRAIELREVVPVGKSRPVGFDAQVVVACQQTPDELVAAGRLREDLAARLCGLVITIPPLSARRADVPCLFDHFLRCNSKGKIPEVSSKLFEALCLYSWPGNVRELELLARRQLALFGDELELRLTQLPDNIRCRVKNEPEAEPVERFSNRVDHDRFRLAKALVAVDGNVKSAAQLTGISRQRAYRLMDGLSPSDFAQQLVKCQ